MNLMKDLSGSQSVYNNFEIDCSIEGAGKASSNRKKGQTWRGYFSPSSRVLAGDMCGLERYGTG